MSETSQPASDVMHLQISDMTQAVPAPSAEDKTAAMMADRGVRRPLLGLAGQVSMMMAQRNALPEEVANAAGVPLSMVTDLMMGQPFDLTFRQFCMIASALDAKCIVQFQFQQPGSVADQQQIAKAQ